MENLADWARNNQCFQFFDSARMRRDFEGNLYEQGGLTGCLRELQLKFDRRPNIILK